MGRFFDSLNTPIAVLVVLVVVVGLNAFLYFAHRSSETPSWHPAERGGHLQKTTMVERTKRRARLREATQPATTLRSTTPTQPSATTSATASSSP